MTVVTYDDGSGIVEHECDQTHHHEDSEPFVVCLTEVPDGFDKLSVHEDRVISIREH